jgi:hypothetical protein
LNYDGKIVTHSVWTWKVFYEIDGLTSSLSVAATREIMFMVYSGFIGPVKRLSTDDPVVNSFSMPCTYSTASEIDARDIFLITRLMK